MPLLVGQCLGHIPADRAYDTELLRCFVVAQGVNR